MALFKRNKGSNPSKTRIVKHIGPAGEPQMRWDANTGTNDRKWETRVEAFQGFQSPPGRF
jgi:hypothetical protein